jgi:hypothetical protein
MKTINGKRRFCWECTHFQEPKTCDYGFSLKGKFNEVCTGFKLKNPKNP